MGHTRRSNPWGLFDRPLSPADFARAVQLHPAPALRLAVDRMSDEQFAAAITASPVTAMDSPAALERMSDEQLNACAPAWGRAVFDQSALLARLSDATVEACARAYPLDAAWCAPAVARLSDGAVRDLVAGLAGAAAGSPAAARMG